MKKKSLIPETTTKEVESYKAEPYKAAPTGIVVKEFYDPDVKPIKSTGISVEEKPVYKNKTVKQLKALAKKKGLKVSGTRKQLIKRIADNAVTVQKERRQKILDNRKEKRQKELEARKEQELGAKNKTDSVNTILQNRLRKLTASKDRAAKELFRAQQNFDKVEANFNEVKITLKSLEKLF